MVWATWHLPLLISEPTGQRPPLPFVLWISRPGGRLTWIYNISCRQRAASDSVPHSGQRLRPAAPGTAGRPRRLPRRVVADDDRLPAGRGGPHRKDARSTRPQYQSSGQHVLSTVKPVCRRRRPTGHAGQDRSARSGQHPKPAVFQPARSRIEPCLRPAPPAKTPAEKRPTTRRATGLDSAALRPSKGVVGAVLHSTPETHKSIWDRPLLPIWGRCRARLATAVAGGGSDHVEGNLVQGHSTSIGREAR